MSGCCTAWSQRPEGSAIPYRTQGSGSPNSRFWDPDLIPCQKPPWGFLTAIDLDTGTFRWRSVLGVVDKLLDARSAAHRRAEYRRIAGDRGRAGVHRRDERQPLPRLR